MINFLDFAEIRVNICYIVLVHTVISILLYNPEVCLLLERLGTFPLFRGGGGDSGKENVTLCVMKHDLLIFSEQIDQLLA